MSHIYHSIQAELMLDALDEAKSAQAIGELIEQHRKLQKEILQRIRDQNEKALLLSFLRLNEGALLAVQNLLLGLNKVNAHLPELAQALRERQQRPMPATYRHIASELERAAREESLQVDLAVLPSRLPLLGGLFTRVKQALHSLSLFYVQKLAWKQAQVNKVHTQAMLFLLQALAEQEAQIKRLQDRQDQ